MKHCFAALAILGFAGLVGCANPEASKTDKTDSATVPNKGSYAQKVNEKQVELYELSNKNGLKIAITNFGGRIVSFMVPDKAGKPTDIVLGYDSLNHYLHNNEAYFGALIGRYGNRIAKGSFQLEGKTYQLPINNAPNSLHGGPKGFHNQVWDAKLIDAQHLELQYVSKDGEEGYPGNLTAKVVYTLTDENALQIDYEEAAYREFRELIDDDNFAGTNELSSIVESPALIDDSELFANAECRIKNAELVLVKNAGTNVKLRMQN